MHPTYRTRPRLCYATDALTHTRNRHDHIHSGKYSRTCNYCVFIVKDSNLPKPWRICLESRIPKDCGTFFFSWGLAVGIGPVPVNVYTEDPLFARWSGRIRGTEARCLRHRTTPRKVRASVRWRRADVAGTICY